MTSGARILAGIKNAIDGDFVRVEIDGHTWVRLDDRYIVVPKEATDDMLRAALRVSRSSDYEAPDPIGGAIWRAMIGCVEQSPQQAND